MDCFRCFFANILFFFVILLSIGDQDEGIVAVHGLGVNWGTRATHPLQADIVVRLMKDNGFKKVKLFEAEPWVLQALGNSGIEVMLGIPNDFLAPLASSVRVAEEWVSQNVSAFVSKYGVDIRLVNLSFFDNFVAAFIHANPIIDFYFFGICLVFIKR